MGGDQQQYVREQAYLCHLRTDRPVNFKKKRGLDSGFFLKKTLNPNLMEKIDQAHDKNKYF